MEIDPLQLLQNFTQGFESSKTKNRKMTKTRAGEKRKKPVKSEYKYQMSWKYKKLK